MTVDEFVKAKVQSEFRPVVANIRIVMKEYAPQIHEAISYGMPTYGLRKPIAWISFQRLSAIMNKRASRGLTPSFADAGIIP